MELRTFFTAHPKAALAFSGGADSAYLLWAAVTAGAEVGAYYVKTAFQPDFELADAKRVCELLGLKLHILELDVLAVPEVADNPKDRCYFCKRAIFSAICQAAGRDGFELVIDGTNASDDEGDRPGMRALRELGVVSPLRLCGVTKKELRRRSREAGLFTHDKPAYACLATRVQSGVPLCAGLLEQVDRAERTVAALGFSDFRVRTDGQNARLEVVEAQLPLAREKWPAICAALAEFTHLTLGERIPRE